MTYNPSVRQFKTDMQNIVNRAKQDFHQTLLRQGEELADNIRRAAPVRTGTLRSSVRVRDASLQDGTKLTVLVIAGGPVTTKHVNGHAYDYSVGTEFGTVNEAPEPFFYSSYRLYKSNGLGKMNETFQQIIDENNRERADRIEGTYTTGSGLFFATETTISHGGVGVNLGNTRI